MAVYNAYRRLLRTGNVPNSILAEPDIPKLALHHVQYAFTIEWICITIIKLTSDIPSSHGLIQKQTN